MKKNLKNLIFAHLLLSFVIFIFFSTNAFSAGSVSSPSSSKASTSSQADENSSLGEEDKEIINIKLTLKMNDYEEAYFLSKNAVLKYPNNPDAWNFLGFSSRKLKKYGESKNAYRKALIIDPEHLGALEYYGELYLTLKQPKKAKELLERLRNLCTLNCKEMKQLEVAIRNFENN